MRTSVSVFVLFVGFAVLLIAASAAIALSFRQDQASTEIRRARDVDRELIVIERAVTDAEAGQRGFLRELRYAVLPTASPNEALQILKQRPDVTLLFTDVVMPEMTGRELADRALATRPDPKVLYPSGYTRDAIVHNGVIDPGTALLPKPFTVAQLAAKIEATLAG